MTTRAAFGTWQSPVSTELITRDSVRLSGTAIDGDSVYWIESRPADGGRYVLMTWSEETGSPVELVPAPFNVRTRVHEYGGGACVVSGKHVLFTNYADQRVYGMAFGETPTPLSADDGSRYADFVMDHRRNRVIAVREDHAESDIDAVTTIAALSLAAETPGAITTLASGRDFYMSPRVSPDGTHLCWLEWDHPNMPWDGCELWVGRIDTDGSIVDRKLIAGGVRESIFQPEWSPDGVLHFVSDRTDWWNLYALIDGTVTPIRPEQAEYGLPAWVFGMSTYAFPDSDAILAASTRMGIWSLESIDRRIGVVTPIDLPSTALSQIQASNGIGLFLAASPVEDTALVRIELASGKLDVLRRASASELERGYLSVPGAVTFPTTDGQVAHAFYYAPHNQDFTGLEGEQPPLMVISHGGPTGSTDTALDMDIQFWTSRGYAVLDVNYRGSTGYGRPYRDALQDTWGIYDVDDCVAGAEHLVAEGLADPARLIIQGSSASGFTTLAALTFRETFAIGSSHYGISDLEAMALDTHKFESRYLDGLIGPYPDAKDVYIARSPIHHVNGLSCPLILFQGTEDKVVPPNQAEMMYEAVKAKGIPVALILYEGEQHGFRKAENIRNVLESELTFFSTVFGLTPADPMIPLAIANM